MFGTSSSLLHLDVGSVGCQEEKLVLLDEADKASAFLVDIEAEKVVSKLHADGYEVRLNAVTYNAFKKHEIFSK